MGFPPGLDSPETAHDFFAQRFSSQGNLNTFERWLCLLGGIVASSSAARGSRAGRLARGSVGLSLLARGAAGHCAMKAALTGETSLTEGLKNQWQQLTSQVAHIVRRWQSRSIHSTRSTNPSCKSFIALKRSFVLLQETLRSVISSSELAFRIEEYSTELKSRQVDLESLLARVGADVIGEGDDAMQALVEETHKMAALADRNVRDAAVTASLQRIVHYKIAGYGTDRVLCESVGPQRRSRSFRSAGRSR